MRACWTAGKRQKRSTALEPEQNGAEGDEDTNPEDRDTVAHDDLMVLEAPAPLQDISHGLSCERRGQTERNPSQHFRHAFQRPDGTLKSSKTVSDKIQK